MITDYIHEAMRRAKYKILEDGTYYGWVEELQGVWANGDSLIACQQELQAVVEDWLLLGLKLGHNITPNYDSQFLIHIPVISASLY